MSANLIDVMGKHFALKNIVKRINGTPVEIKGYVDLDTMGNIVRTVAQSCFQKGVYHAEYREVVRRFAILKYLTDIEVEEKNLDEIFKTTQGSNWYAEIEREVTSLPIWTEIEIAIDRQIEYIIATRQTAFDDLCNNLSEVLTSNPETDLTEVKEVLETLNEVDKGAVVKTAAKRAARKKK